MSEPGNSKAGGSAAKYGDRDNKVAKQSHVKSRNKDQDGGLANPNDLMFFNSNREKSPVPDGTGDDERNQVLLGADSLATTGDESQFAGTGETGAPKSDKKDSEKVKATAATAATPRQDSRIEQKTLQQSLANKFGKYDHVI